MTVTINPLSNACGVEILGVDMKADLSKADTSKIYQAWLDYLVLVIRDQHGLTQLTKKNFVAISVKLANITAPRNANIRNTLATKSCWFLMSEKTDALLAPILMAR